MSSNPVDLVGLPRPVEWFINRTNAGDIDSILDTLVGGAVIHHAGHALDWYAMTEFLASPWYLGGYIHLALVDAHEGGEEDWAVQVAVTGTSRDLRAVDGSLRVQVQASWREDRDRAHHIGVSAAYWPIASGGLGGCRAPRSVSPAATEGTP